MCHFRKPPPPSIFFQSPTKQQPLSISNQLPFSHLSCKEQQPESSLWWKYLALYLLNAPLFLKFCPPPVWLWAGRIKWVFRVFADSCGSKQC